MKIVYIAGPFRGPNAWAIECNVRVAENAALSVAMAGFCPLCPHAMFRHFDKTLPDSFWLSATQDLLRRCDAMLLVGNWERSQGALAEKVLAESLNIPVVYDVAELRS